MTSNLIIPLEINRNSFRYDSDWYPINYIDLMINEIEIDCLLNDFIKDESFSYS